MRNKTLLTLAVAGLLLGACGGNGDEVGTASPTSTSTKPPTTSTQAPATSVVAPATTMATVTTVAAGPSLNDSSTLDLRGIGPVRVGMTLAEATAAAGVPISSATAMDPACAYATVEGPPAGVNVMVVDGKIARVDIGKTSAVKTRSGAGIGDTEADVKALYPGIEVSDHKYVAGGHYLTLVPTDPADAEYRLIFATDGSTVTAFHSGRLPEVSYIEGCS